MKAIIQAGGKGTRLKNITKGEIPKPMVPICGKPLLQWQLEKLRENEIVDIYIIIGYLGEVIRQYFGDGTAYGVQIKYIEETEPLGSAGALFYMRPYVRQEEDILMVYGDVFFDICLERMVAFHKDRLSELTTFVHPNTHPEDSDIVCADENQRVTGILSKGEMRDFWYENQVNAAFYILKGSVIHEVPSACKLDFEQDIMKRGIEQGKKIYAYRSTEYIKDAGTEKRMRSVGADIVSGYIEKRNLRNKQKCIFIDRDGTVNQFKGLIDKEEKLELIEGAAQGIGRANVSQYLVIIVTNQPVVARGMCSIDDVERIHKKLQTLLGKEGVYVDDIAYCPHHPNKGYPGENPEYKIKCNCRKPHIGLIEKMAEKYNISLRDSWMVGDTTRDIMAGKNAGMKTALVLTGEAGKDRIYNVQADMVFQDLYEAVTHITQEKIV